MANKFDGDVRPLSNDPLYMGVVFSGSLKRALTVAHAAPDYGMVHQPGRPARISRDRWNLLEHLNLSRHYTQAQVEISDFAVLLDMANDQARYEMRAWQDAKEAELLALQSEWEQGDKSMTWTEFKNADRKPPKRAPAPSKPSVFSLEYAVARWPESFSNRGSV